MSTPVPRRRYRDLPDWRSQFGSLRVRDRIWYPDDSRPEYLIRDTKYTYRPDYNVGRPVGCQITDDELHSSFHQVDRLGKAGLQDLGGNFTSQKQGVFYGVMGQSGPIFIDPFAFIDTKASFSGNTYRSQYWGPYGSRDPMTLDLPTVDTAVSLNTLGATAIARCKPTNSVAEVGTAIGELFNDGLPKLPGVGSWENKTQRLRDLPGDEYLNATFGWAPLVGDVQDISYAAANAGRILSQYERNAGRIVRRRYEFPIESSKTSTDVGASDGYMLASTAYPKSSIPAPRIYKEVGTYRKVWFSGAFTYHLPTDYHSRNRLMELKTRADVLLGINLHPNTLWNLAPWSWAVDWFSNTGDVISNLSDWATDGLVMRYGYVMEHYFRYETYLAVGQGRFAPDYRLPTPVTTYVERKRRIKASPFGFGLTINMMSPRQLAIIAALGISRVF